MGDYYGHERSEMAPFIPASARRILEVGCGAGAFGALVKGARDCEYWGIEPNADACAVARRRLDRVLEMPFRSGALEGERFDCVVFNDVLEHLTDPEAALAECRALLSPSGHVVASVPNLRYLPCLLQLVVLGELEYGDEGVLDRTHLRLFTRKSASRMFERQGFRLVALAGINGCYLRRRERWLAAILGAISLGQMADLRYLQYAVVATPVAPGAEAAGAVQRPPV
jgi:2-polyprenyl-3-methyl-5-hydroxy-6-metoxy-1,4-benzoquinol methylase